MLETALDKEGLIYYDGKSKEYIEEKITALDSKKIDKTTVATSSTLGLVKSGTDITVDASGNVSVNNNSHQHTVSNISDLTATASELNVLDGITASTTELNYVDGVTSNIQTQLNAKAPLASPTLTGTPKAPTASAGTNTTQIATTAFVTTAVANGIAASDAMIIKGTIGTSGTVATLPTTYKTGWTYRVVTAGTYVGQVCEIGDLIVALVDRSGSGNVDSDWCVAQTNINGAITGIKSGDAYITTSQSGSVVTITHKDVTRTNTTSTASPTHGGTFTAVKTVTSDAKGHVTGVDTETVTLPAYGVATQSTDGLESATDKKKLDGIATGAEVNQNAFSNVVVGSTTISADSKTDTLTLAAGSNVTITPDATNDKITISSSHPTISKSTNTTSTASPSAGGTFTAIDSVKTDSNGHVTTVNTKTVTLPSTSVTVDSALSSTSTNPVQNKVVNTALTSKAPKSHASTATTYGGGTASNYGHVKLSDSYTTSAGAASASVAASSKAVADAYAEINSNLANKIQVGTINVRTTTANGDRFIGISARTVDSYFPSAKYVFAEGGRISGTNNSCRAYVDGYYVRTEAFIEGEYPIRLFAIY